MFLLGTSLAPCPSAASASLSKAFSCFEGRGERRPFDDVWFYHLRYTLSAQWQVWRRRRFLLYGFSLCFDGFGYDLFTSKLLCVQTRAIELPSDQRERADETNVYVNVFSVFFRQPQEAGICVCLRHVPGKTAALPRPLRHEHYMWRVRKICVAFFFSN